MKIIVDTNIIFSAMLNSNSNFESTPKIQKTRISTKTLKHENPQMIKYQQFNFSEI
jgi:predicted nucleic acid-binding protein